MPPTLPAALAADAALVQSGRLDPACASFERPANPETPTRALALLLHGYSAGPWQFTELAERLAAHGIHSYAARLPGHGARAADGRESWHELPRSRQLTLYRDCAADALARAATAARALNVPLQLVGFSLGGALALDIAARHGAQLQRLVLVAPLLQPRGRMARLLYRVYAPLLHLGAGALLDRRRSSWGNRPAVPPADWVRPGHWEFVYGNLFAVLAYAHRVHRASTALTVPTQLIVSDADVTIDPDAACALVRRAHAPHAVLRLDARLQVPHAMLSAWEHPHAASRELVQSTIVDFLASGRSRDATLTELP